MQLFSADAIVFSKNLKNIFFDPENMKKPPSKVAHNWPQFLFHKNLPPRNFSIMTLKSMLGHVEKDR